MKRDIVKDIIFLQQKAAPATFEDKAIAEDLKTPSPPIETLARGSPRT